LFYCSVFLLQVGLNKLILMRKLILVAIATFLQYELLSQGIGIGTATPHASAQLDITSTSKGLLIPRMTSALRTSIVSPAKGLLVYDSTTNSFWVHTGSVWTNLASSSTSWSLTGNSGTNPSTNYIGTNDNVGLLFKVNSINVGQLTTNGNIFWGLFSGLNNTIGIRNTTLGYQALYNNTEGSNNTATGSETLLQNTTGNNNTASGFGALANNTIGSYNTGLGVWALQDNTTGEANTAIGAVTLESNTEGGGNTAIGYGALSANTTGGGNSALGVRSLEFNSTGTGNTAIGLASLQNSTGISNTAIGTNSLINLNSGNYNSGFGFNTAINSGLSNSTAIGARSKVDCSNCMVLGSVNGINGALSNVNVGIGTTSPQQMLSVGSSINVDQSNANNGNVNPGISFGSLSGEAIASKRTGGGNQYGLDFYTNSVNRMSITNSGNVGIGITNPQATLHLGNSGVLKINDASGSRYVQIFHSNTGNLHIDAFGGGTNYISWYGGSGLHVGNGSAGGYGPVNASAFIVTSSERFKKNIINTHYGLAEILQLQGKEYNYTFDKDGRNEIGLIAEEVEKIIPEAVYRNTPEHNITGIDYGKLVPVLIEAIKLQQKQIDDLKKLVESVVKQPYQ
jgi:Chaperone of endosialidase